MSIYICVKIDSEFLFKNLNAINLNKPCIYKLS